jgi:hypothetical protein
METLLNKATTKDANPTPVRRRCCKMRPSLHALR